MLPLICCLLCFVCGIFTGIQKHHTVCLNSSVYCPDIVGVKTPRFTIIKVEEAADSQHHCIAEYTIETGLFSKENAKGYKYHTFKFYAPAGKYNVSDKLTLITYNE